MYNIGRHWRLHILGWGEVRTTVGQSRGPSGAFIWYARYLADLQAMPRGGVCSLESKGHPRPARLLSARFGKAGARAAMPRSLSSRSTKGETAASPPYGSFLHFWDLGSDMRGLNASSTRATLRPGIQQHMAVNPLLVCPL